MTPIPDLSIVVPVYNEEENVFPMLDEIVAVSGEWPWAWELVYVDDGSSDATWAKIREAREKDPRVRAVRLAENCGQTSAVKAGVVHSRAKICVTLDGDCQNDPADIPKLMNAMTDNSLVIGWRSQRIDNEWRRFQSRVANGVRNWFTSEEVHDIGCAIKAFERDKMLEVPLFEGMHRFMPTLFRFKGWSIGEVEVNHRARERGVTKYGMWNRVFRALRDMVAVRWMGTRMIRYRLSDEDTID